MCSCSSASCITSQVLLAAVGVCGCVVMHSHECCCKEWPEAEAVLHLAAAAPSSPLKSSGAPSLLYV